MPKFYSKPMVKAACSCLFGPLLFAALLLSGAASFAQVPTIFTSGSNLPIVVITTDGSAAIPDEPKIGASMKIIYRGAGQRNYVADQSTAGYLNYDGRIAIEKRGSSSQTAPKKGYGFETRASDNVTNKNVKLMNMPSENDWILNGLAFDPTLMHDYLTYNLSRNMGQYAAATVYCEVILNNDYQGVYLLQEKIKQDDNRVNIAEISTTDNSGINLTGGYIVKADKTTGGDPVAFQLNGGYGLVDFVYDTPDPTEITSNQKAYVNPIFSSLQSNASNASIVNGYPSIIEIPTFVDFMIINELASNADAYTYSTYFHKDKGGKLRAGPVWDFNYAYGLVGGTPDGRSDTKDWQFESYNNVGPYFIRDLFYNTTYRCYLVKRWLELTMGGAALSTDKINELIDATKLTLDESAARDNARWGTIGVFQNQINYLKTFIQARSIWIANNIGTTSACTAPTIPALVINEIMYNPKTSTGDPDDQEFIEIKNNSSSEIDLTGIYFNGLGLSYQFPANAKLAANGLLVLASSMDGYNAKYGKTAFGQFSRHLSNKSQKILLADAFGNTIDLVEYFDSAPWPTSADGGGKSLELINVNSNNNLASSWQASSTDNGSPGLDNTNPLPVTLISFTGSSAESTVKLDWQVVDEINVDGYVVENSRNGKSFSQIGKVPANKQTLYTFSQHDAASGINYYRLKSLDKDGSYAYSRMISVEVKNGRDFVFYPNPVSDVLCVDLRPEFTGRTLTVSIMATDGKVISRKIVTNTSTTELIDVSKIGIGKYIVRIEADNNSISKEVEVVR